MGGCESPGARILLRGEYYCVGITTAWGWAGLLHQRQGVGGGVGEGGCKGVQKPSICLHLNVSLLPWEPRSFRFHHPERDV